MSAWWAWLELNYRPHPYQLSAATVLPLTITRYKPLFIRLRWHSRYFGQCRHFLPILNEVCTEMCTAFSSLGFGLWLFTPA